jgi:formamidopyrimidine-DNA glycosylase
MEPMFELPEFTVLAGQINKTLTGKVIKMGNLGNTPHKFVWYNRTPEEFTALTKGKRIGKARSRGKWLFIPLEPGYVLLLGECGGKVLYHPPESDPPKKYHLLISFEDASSLSVITQMWGAMELFEQGKERDRQYVKDMRPTPVDPEFTSDYLADLINNLVKSGKRSVKSLLTQDQLIPGLGNAITQDILFRARLHPRHPIDQLTPGQRKRLHRAIVKTVADVIAQGGRCDEFTLFNQPGGYVRIMDKNAAGRGCPECGRKIRKIQYLGGTCYFCPGCQPYEN